MRAFIAAASHGAAHNHIRVVRIKNFSTGLGFVRRICKVSQEFVRIRKDVQGFARICEVSHKDLSGFVRICQISQGFASSIRIFAVLRRFARFREDCAVSQGFAWFRQGLQAFIRCRKDL